MDATFKYAMVSAICILLNIVGIARHYLHNRRIVDDKEMDQFGPWVFVVTSLIFAFSTTTLVLKVFTTYLLISKILGLYVTYQVIAWIVKNHATLNANEAWAIQDLFMPKIVGGGSKWYGLLKDRLAVWYPWQNPSGPKIVLDSIKAERFEIKVEMIGGLVVKFFADLAFKIVSIRTVAKISGDFEKAKKLSLEQALSEVGQKFNEYVRTRCLKKKTIAGIVRKKIDLEWIMSNTEQFISEFQCDVFFRFVATYGIQFEAFSIKDIDAPDVIDAAGNAKSLADAIRESAEKLAGKNQPATEKDRQFYTDRAMLLAGVDNIKIDVKSLDLTAADGVDPATKSRVAAQVAAQAGIDGGGI